MNVVRSLACAGTLAAIAFAAAAAEPALVWTMGAGMPTGPMTLMGQPHGGIIQSVTLVFNLDSGQVDTPTASNVAVGAGWQLTNFTRLSANSVRLDMFNNAGQSVPGPVAAITFRHKQTGFHAATITLSGSSNILLGEDSDGFPGPFGVDEQAAAFVYGTVRDVGNSAPGSVALGEDHGAPVAAVAADDHLFLFDPASDTLADEAGWTGGKAINDSVSHRPAFGEIAGALVLAAGTDTGRGLVYRVSDGSPLSDTNLGFSVAGTPAVAGTKGDIYWPVLTNDGPAITHQRVGGATDTVSLGDASDMFISSPAVWNNVLVAGTQTAAQTFRADPDTGVLTPQAGGPVARDMFNTAAVVVDGMAYIGAESGKVYQMNVGTGAPGGVASLPPAAAPLSNPFYDAAGKAVAFGGADGVLYRISTTDLTVSGLKVDTQALNSPVVLGENTYVSDASGNLLRVTPSGKGGPPLSTGLAPAMGIVRGAPGLLILNTTDGAVVAIPLS